MTEKTNSGKDAAQAQETAEARTPVWSREEMLTSLKRTAAQAADNVIACVYSRDGGIVGEKYDAGAAGILMKAVEMACRMCGYDQPEPQKTAERSLSMEEREELLRSIGDLLA